MPKQVMVSFFIEMGLIAVTLFFLVQPSLVFNKLHERTRVALTVSGLVMLCVTFCWSVILGIILTLHRI
jgi:hypothetical protein